MGDRLVGHKSDSMERTLKLALELEHHGTQFRASRKAQRAKSSKTREANKGKVETFFTIG